MVASSGFVFSYVVVFLFSVVNVNSINNGVGRVPALGWSSWYASYAGSQVTEELVRNTTLVMVEKGLAKLG